MTVGFLLTSLLGLLWAAVGITVALARRRNCPIWHFYTAGSGGAAFLCWIWWSFDPVGSGAIPRLLLFTAPAAIFNALGQALTMYNLKSSGRALAFALPQTNFIFPFLYAGIFLGGVFNVLNVTGLALITAAILCSGQRETENGSRRALLSFRELGLGVAAAVIVGMGQIFLLYAADTGGDAPPILKSALILTVSTAVYGTGAWIDRRRPRRLKFRSLRYGLLWSIAATLSYYVLFCSIAVMAESNRSGVVFALAGSMTIVLFWLFSALKLRDRVSKRQIAILLLILAGIVTIRLG